LYGRNETITFKSNIMKKLNQVIETVVNKINLKKSENGKISRNEINAIIDLVCEEQNFKGNEFSICYTLGIA
jgi:hypothetical protein